MNVCDVHPPFVFWGVGIAISWKSKWVLAIVRNKMLRQDRIGKKFSVPKSYYICCCSKLLSCIIYSKWFGSSISTLLFASDIYFYCPGNLTLEAYEDDCEFADPAGSFRGLRRFKRNCTNFGSLLEKSSMKLTKWEDFEVKTLKSFQIYHNHLYFLL